MILADKIIKQRKKNGASVGTEIDAPRVIDLPAGTEEK